MAKQILLKSKIKYRNALVFRVIYDDPYNPDNELNHFKFKSKIQKKVFSTWGYSGFYINTVTNKSFTYWFFTNPEDAIMFRLSSELQSKQTPMWPNSVEFTIHEF